MYRLGNKNTVHPQMTVETPCKEDHIKSGSRNTLKLEILFGKHECSVLQAEKDREQSSLVQSTVLSPASTIIWFRISTRESNLYVCEGIANYGVTL